MIWRGIAIGVLISAPMGPVGILCIQRTLDKGRKAGLYTGVGAALSDLIYCLLTGFGLSFIEEFIERNSSVIQLAGSAVLIAFGIFLFRKNPAGSLKRPLPSEVSAKKSILGGFLFTFSNPLILFLIIGLFARFNFLMPDIRFYHYIIGYIAILGGALGWWWLVTFLINKVRSHFNLRSMWLINRIIGCVILIFAIVGIVTSISALAKASPTPMPRPTSTEAISQHTSPDIQADYDQGEALTYTPDIRYGYRHFNPHRGFAPLAADDATGITSNPSSSPILLTVPTDAEGDFAFRCALRAEGGKQPAFGILLKNATLLFPGHTTAISADILLDIKEIRPFSGFNLKHYLEISAKILPIQASASSLSISAKDATARLTNRIIESYSIKDTPCGWRLALEQGRLSLSGGFSSLERVKLPILDKLRVQSVEEIGLEVYPKSKLSLISAELMHPVAQDARPTSRYTLEDIQYLISRSDDPLEGYWEAFDHSLDDDQLRSGGDYRLAMLRAPEGYELYYISGANVNASLWQPGHLKGRLIRTADPAIFDLTWYDAAGIPFNYGLKAHHDTPTTLTLHFPNQRSQIRFIRK